MSETMSSLILKRYTPSVCLDLSCGKAFCIHGNDFISKAGDILLPLTDYFRLKGFLPSFIGPFFLPQKSLL